MGVIEMSLEKIGTKIKNLREEKGLKQNELVDKLTEKRINISRETLSKIENNSRTISAIELNAICNVLNVRIDVIFSEEEEDLVTLFRRKGIFSNDTLEEIENLQGMIKVFINQEKIYKGEFKPQRRKPLWEECIN